MLLPATGRLSAFRQANPIRCSCIPQRHLVELIHYYHECCLEGEGLLSEQQLRKWLAIPLPRPVTLDVRNFLSTAGYLP